MDRYVPLPPLPGRISRLNELAYDLWWSWNPQAREVFRDLDYPLWRFTDHNPVLLLHLVDPERLEHAASDPEFLRLYDEAIAGLDLVRTGTATWWSRRVPTPTAPIAFIAREFALHQSLPADVRAASVLTGDFCKEASDLGLPLVAVGLMYARGFAHQRMAADGWQQEAIEYVDWSDAPIGPALTPEGERLVFSLKLGSSDVRVAVWQVRAGRVTIYLLDTDLQENSAWDRELSGGAFAEDSDARLRQSLLLGAGAVRALDALSIEPAAWHLANGTSAFVVAERLQRLVASGESFAEALAIVRHTTTFTTRDARPSRADAFPFSALDRQVGTVWPSLSETRDQLMELGRHDGDRGPSFNTSVFALRSASVANVPDTAAGSASAAWQSAAAPATTIAIRTIADGVHVPTWISRDLADLLTEHIGDGWRDLQDETAVWEAVRRIPDSELWAVRQRLRGYLIDFMRDRARRRWTREQGVTSRLVALGTLLDGSTLTIGFARRFTDGTRADLIFHDTERLARMVTASRRPVQFVFAGKAHPGDETGKHLLQRTFKQALEPAFGGRIAFLEDYDLHVARLLVQGCDVWLSTPPPGGHASVGGLKAAINGVPHLATPAAWWADGWTGTNGWMIDGGRAADRAAQDVADARALYTLLEEQVVPAFYGRDRGGAPTRWVALIKEAIAAAMPRSCARRAVKAFAEAAYLPAVKTTV